MDKFFIIHALRDLLNAKRNYTCLEAWTDLPLIKRESVAATGKGMLQCVT